MWGSITGREMYHTRCPLCRARVLTGAGLLVPQHLTEGMITCDGSGRSWTWVRATAELRLRAHP